MESYHIAGYTFSADIHCCDCIAEWARKELMNEGYSTNDIEDIAMNSGKEYDVGFFAYRSEALIYKLAEVREIDVEDEYSYDSDDFPKIIFADQIEEDEYCGTCHEILP